MNAFTRAATVLFNDPNLSVCAVYGLPNGASIPVRVIRRDTEGEGPINGDRVQSNSTTFELLMSAVPERPVKGSTISIGPDTFTTFDTDQNVRKGVWILYTEAIK